MEVKEYASIKNHRGMFIDESLQSKDLHTYAPTTDANALRALLIEDNRICLKALFYLLRDCGYAVDAAENGAVALAFLKKNTYSLVLTDLGLPDISGIEIIKQLRRDPKHRDTLVIVQSAHLDKTIQKQCMLAGCDAVLSKPVTQELFKATLEAIGANKK